MPRLGIWPPSLALLVPMSRREPEQPGDLTRAIAEELRALMGRRKMSKVALAQESGVGLRSLNRYLDAERTFTLETLDKLARALGLASGAEVIVAARQPHPPQGHQSGQSA